MFTDLNSIAVLLTEQQISELLGIQGKTLSNWRARGVGPKYIKVGHHVRYRPEDIKAYLSSRVFSSTAEFSRARNRK